LKISKCAGIERTESCVIRPRCQTLGRKAVGVRKAKFGGAEEVGFTLAWLRGERNSGG